MIELPDRLANFVEEAGIEISGSREVSHGTQYYFRKDEDKANLTVFQTGKVLVQGKSSSKLKESLEARTGSQHSGETRTRPDPAGVGQSRPRLDGTPRLGIDEAGKGEYFGPLVMAGARITDGEKARRLQEIRVRDSKALGVDQARLMADSIMEALGADNVRVVSLAPREFELKRSASGNVNLLLGEISAQIVGELEDEVECVVVDEFAKAARSYIEPYVPGKVRLEVRSRADTDDAAVAAASVLARGRYLREMEFLSEEVGFELPRGATHVLEPGRRIVRQRGLEGLADVAKISFSTTDQILGSLEEL